MIALLKNSRQKEFQEASPFLQQAHQRILAKKHGNFSQCSVWPEQQEAHLNSALSDAVYCVVIGVVCSAVKNVGNVNSRQAAVVLRTEHSEVRVHLQQPAVKKVLHASEVKRRAVSRQPVRALVSCIYVCF